MGLFFAPVANVVLSAVRPEEEGQASGANNAIREVGGVFGVAVLAAVFSRLRWLLRTPQTFVDGMKPAILIGAAFVARRRRWRRSPSPSCAGWHDPEMEPEAFPIGDAEPEQAIAN